METTRQQKVSRLLQKNLGEIFQVEGRSLFGSPMITVTKVHVTKDLSQARIFLSLFATNDKTGLLNSIKATSKEIRFRLGQRIRNQVRVIPELEFFIDDSLDYIENIEKLLKQ